MFGKILAAGLTFAAVTGFSTPCFGQEKAAVIYGKDNAPAAPKLGEMPLKSSVSQYGMTWTFDKPAHVGQFVNGDYYVVGPVTIIEITPKPLYGAEIPANQLGHMDKERPVASRVRNGFMLNPPVAQKVAYDSGVRNYFDPSLIRKLPVTMKPGDALVSTISMPAGLKLRSPLATGPQERWVNDPQMEDVSPTKDAAVLTCLAEPAPADAFRPAYCDRTQKMYFARNLKRELLPSLALPADAPKLQEYIKYTQRPWVNTCFFGFEQPNENMPFYGREIGRVTGNAGLLLCSNAAPEQKEPLLIGLVQVGIDYGGLIRAGHPGFPAFGGHGTGRKFPIVFAGVLMGDDELARINKHFPKAAFGEDEQTAYGDSWTGAKVVFTGHSAIDETTGIGRDYVRSDAAWGPYEHMHPKTWGPGQWTSEGYRRTSSTNGWVSEALTLRLLHAEEPWDHDAFFDYVDRWMCQPDTAALATFKALGQDYNHTWSSQGNAWPDDNFVNEMWTTYRAASGMPPTDGWTKQHDESYYKNAIAKELKSAAERK